MRLSSLPFGECARDFEIVTDNVDDFKGSHNINEKSGRSHLQVFLGSGALIDVIHSTLGARGDYLCRKGVRPMKLANQTLSMEYETSPKLLKMNINEEGEDTKATLRFEFDVFGKSIGSNEPEEDKKRSPFSGKFQLPFNPDVEFEGEHASEIDVTGGIGIKAARGAEISENGIDVILVNGEFPSRVLDAIEGKSVIGTRIMSGNS